jgi:hypothetical protein
MQVKLSHEDVQELVRSPEFRDAIRLALAEDALVQQAMESKRKYAETVVGVMTTGVDQKDIINKVIAQLVGEERRTLRAEIAGQVRAYAAHGEVRDMVLRLMVSHLEGQLQELRDLQSGG